MLKAKNIVITFCICHVITMLFCVFIEQANFEYKARQVDYMVRLAGDMALEMVQNTDDFFTSENPYGYDSGTSYTMVTVPGSGVSEWIDITSVCVANPEFSTSKNQLAAFNVDDIGQFKGRYSYWMESVDEDTPLIHSDWGLHVPLVAATLDDEDEENGTTMVEGMPETVAVLDNSSGYMVMEVPDHMTLWAIRDTISRPVKAGNTYMWIMDIGEVRGKVQVGYYNGNSFVKLLDETNLTPNSQLLYAFQASGVEFKPEIRVYDSGNTKGKLEYNNFVITKVSFDDWNYTEGALFIDHNWTRADREEVAYLPSGAENSIRVKNPFKIAAMSPTAYAQIEAKVLGQVTVVLSEFETETAVGTGTLIGGYSENLASTNDSEWEDVESKAFALNESTGFVMLAANGTSAGASGAYLDDFYLKIYETAIRQWEVGSLVQSESIVSVGEEFGVNLSGSGKPYLRQNVANLEIGEKYRMLVDYISNDSATFRFGGTTATLNPASMRTTYTSAEFTYTGNVADHELAFELQGASDNSYINLISVRLERYEESDSVRVELIPNQSGNSVVGFWNEPGRRDLKPSQYTIMTDTGGTDFEEVNLYDYYFKNTTGGGQLPRATIFRYMYTENSEFQQWARGTRVVTTEFYNPSQSTGGEAANWTAVPTILQMGKPALTGASSLPSYNDNQLLTLYKMNTSIKQGYFGDYYYTPVALGMTYLDRDLLEFLFNNNMDLLMRLKYQNDTNINGIRNAKGSIQNNALGYTVPDSVLESESLINNGYFMYKRGVLRWDASKNRKYFDDGGKVNIEYKIIDIFDSSNEGLLKTVYGANRVLNGSAIGSKAQYMKLVSTKRLPSTGGQPSKLYAVVAKVSFNADIVVPYSTPAIREWAYRFIGGGNLRNPVIFNTRSPMFKFNLQRDFSDDGAIAGDYGSTMYNYTTYFSVTP